jgi:tetratricopeptide (TPR) repeat protein
LKLTLGFSGTDLALIPRALVQIGFIDFISFCAPGQPLDMVHRRKRRMTKVNLRASLMALFLGTAAATSAVLAMPTSAQAVTVSAKVATLLNEAQDLAAAGNYKAAMTKAVEAQAAGSSQDDTSMISQMKQYIGAKSGDPVTGGAPGARVKLVNDYNAGRFHEVIADGELLRRIGALDSQSVAVIAQSYYKTGDTAGCVRFVKTHMSIASVAALDLQVRCAYETGDEVSQRLALETLVSRSENPENWKNLLDLSERNHSLSDHNALDISRIRFLATGLKTNSDYILLAELALQFGNAAEAKSVIEKGMTAKLLNDDRSARMLNLTTRQAAGNTANLSKNIAAAQAQAQGDALVKIGEDMIGQGQAKKAIEIIQQGLKKPLKDAANGNIRLGQAYLAAGQKEDARKAFAAVKETETDAMVAHLWTLASRIKAGV